jgi:hypothetical protein
MCVSEIHNPKNKKYISLCVFLRFATTKIIKTISLCRFLRFAIKTIKKTISLCVFPRFATKNTHNLMVFGVCFVLGRVGRFGEEGGAREPSFVRSGNVLSWTPQ